MMTWAPTRPSAARLLAGALVLTLGLAPCTAQAGVGYRGRPLREVLAELQQRGLDLIFSSAVVSKRLRVLIEPTAVEPRAVLDEILSPVGLQAEDGPDGTILILPAPPPAGWRGCVVSAVGGRPIAYAAIRRSWRGPVLQTDADGCFVIDEMPPGVHEIRVAARGFVQQTLAVEGGSKTTVERTVALDVQPSYATKVIVTPGRHSIIRQEQAPRRTMGHQDSLVIPTIGGDVSRLVESLAGVASGDNAASFHVRGSTTEDVSFILDGLELYDPFHLQSLQSPFSLIDTNVVDQLDVLEGGYTAELGDRHGGFVQMSTLPSASQPGGEIEIGTLNSRASYRSPGPATRGPWLLSARAWYPSAIFETVEFAGEEQLDPLAGDFYAKSVVALGERFVLSGHTLLAYDRVKFVESDETVGERVDVLAQSGYAWLRLHGAWIPGWDSQTLLSVGRVERSRDGSAVPDEDRITVADDRSVDFVGLKHDSTWEASPSRALKAGFELRQMRASYRYDLTNRAEPDDATTLSLDPSGVSLAVYTAYRTAFGPRLATEIGLRWDQQNYTDDHQLSPRLNAVWRPADRTELRLAWGRFNQSQRIHELDVEDGETEFQPAETADQVDLTAQHELKRGLRLRLDAYHRTLSGVRPRHENLFEPFELFPEVYADRVTVDPRDARSRGAELLAQGREDQPWVWWVSYALSSADDRIDGVRVPRSWDQTHAGRFLIGYHREGRWWISLSGTGHTGWPTTPATGNLVSRPGEPPEYEFVPGARNTERYPTYLRLDFKARRAIALSRGRLWLTLEVANLTDRQNVCCVGDFRFEPQPDGAVAARPEFDSWIGITPSGTITWEF